jgi:hypothetical protein
VRRVWQVTTVCEASSLTVRHHYVEGSLHSAIVAAVTEHVHDEGYVLPPDGAGALHTYTHTMHRYGAVTAQVKPLGQHVTLRWLACPADEVLEAIAVAMRGGS